MSNYKDHRLNVLLKDMIMERFLGFQISFMKPKDQENFLQTTEFHGEEILVLEMWVITEKISQEDIMMVILS